MKKIIGAFLFLGLIIGAFVGYQYVAQYLRSAVTISKDYELLIYPDEDYNDVMQNLEPILKNKDGFDKFARLKKYDQLVKPGRYVISPSTSTNSLVNKLRGGMQDPSKVKFNAHFSLREVAGSVSKHLMHDSATIYQAIMNHPKILERVKTPTEINQFFIPNTYEMYWNTSVDSFIEKMLKEYDNFWNEDRLAKAKKLNMTPIEVISLGAIVQGETAKIDERPRVAGLYLNRLRKGMKLQADPTVIFCIQQQKGYDYQVKRVLYKDLKIDSPYNTYKYKGVPPAPIRIASITAIDAVLNAEKHDYIFMCASVENFGYHEFAVTGAEHERNRKKYTNYLDEHGVKR